MLSLDMHKGNIFAGKKDTDDAAKHNKPGFTLSTKNLEKKTLAKDNFYKPVFKRNKKVSDKNMAGRQRSWKADVTQGLDGIKKKVKNAEYHKEVARNFSRIDQRPLHSEKSDILASVNKSLEQNIELAQRN